MQTERYSPISMGFHWLVAVAIFAGFGLGLYMVDLRFSPAKLQYYNWHKWIGVTVFWLAALRLAWRWWRPPPPPPAGQPRWQTAAAHLAHVAMYALMFLIPVSGWLFSSSTGFTTVYLGVLPLPDLIEKNAEIKDTLKAVHWYLSMALAALLALHVLAALKHQWVDRDGTLARMLPGRRIRSIDQRPARSS